MREFPSVEQVLNPPSQLMATPKTFVPLLLPIGIDTFLGALLMELTVFAAGLTVGTPSFLAVRLALTALW